MANDEYGESSRKPEENDKDRPLKKARYVWEVKGKYHLKEALKQNETSRSEEDVRTIHGEAGRQFPGKRQRRIEIDDSDNNNVSLNNNQEDCCREALIAQVDHIMTVPDCESSVCSEDDSSDDERSGGPVSLVSDKQMDYNYHLRNWQARHLARGFVDNTINRVIESCGMRNELQQVHYLEICELLKNCTDDMSDADVEVEAEGIAMAIQSHGLQTQNSNASGPDPRLSNETDATANTEIRGENDISKDSSSSEAADSGNSTDSTNSMSCESLNHQEQDDFMNAAVSAAIQNKGLSSAYS